MKSATYLPTGSMQLLHSLRAAFTKFHLFLADFDALPPPAVDERTVADIDNIVTTYAPAACSPLVASKDAVSRRTCDHSTYMSAQAGTADIFFPTRFESLAAMVKDVILQQQSCGERRSAYINTIAPAAAAPAPVLAGCFDADGGVKVLSSAAFFRQFAQVDRTRTIGGYNPLLEDYPNTRVLLS